MTRNPSTRAAFVSATLVFTLACGAASAMPASSSPDVPSRVVRYSDLDITRTSGAAALYARIEAAARSVCQPAFGFPETRMEGELRKCQRQAIDRAVNDVNAPLLTSHYAAQHPDNERR
jgi:UrcA family protein